MAKKTVKEEIESLKEALVSSENNQEMLEEALATLESQLQEQGWIQLFGGGGKEFTKTTLNTLYDLARVYWMKNPLIRRSVEVQALYVFAQGMSVKADHPDLDGVIQRFMNDRKNIPAFTSHLAWMQNERELSLSGNLFLALFTEPTKGRVIIRSIPLYEINQVIANPDDREEVWYYQRLYLVNSFDSSSGNVASESRVVYHPDWKYSPQAQDKPETIGGYPIMWDAPIYHAKVNCLPDMTYGIPEVYSAIDWAQAYKKFLENWSKLVEAYARFAFHLTTRGGSSRVAAAKAKLESIFGKPDPGTESFESSTTPTQRGVASVLTSGEGVKLDAVRTSGATTQSDDARRLLLMVASASGIPEQILAGDPSTGNLATAKAMERPLELQFMNRQTIWMDIWWDILQYVIDQAIKAGVLQGEEVVDEITGEVTYHLTLLDDDGKEVPRSITIKFPPLLEHDIEQMIRAIVSGATLDGKPLAGTMDLNTVASKILQALNVENAEEVMAELFPEGEKVLQTDSAMVDMIVKLMNAGKMDPWALAEPEQMKSLIRFLKEQEDEEGKGATAK